MRRDVKYWSNGHTGSGTLSVSITFYDLFLWHVNYTRLVRSADSGL